MPLTSVPNNSKVLIQVQVGTDAEGKGIFRTRTYNNLKASAPDADVYAVAAGIASLQAFPVATIKRVDSEDLINTL